MKIIIKLKIILLSALILVNLIVFQNCSNSMSPMDLDSQANNGSIGANSIESQALSVLNNKCTQCHNETISMANINYINDVPSLKYFRLAVPGQASVSPLYTVLSSREDHMSILNQSEVQLIFNWIQAGIEARAPGAPPVIIPLGPTFNSISRNILGPRCTRCHSGPTPSGGRNYSNYAGFMAVVNPNNAAGSAIIQRVTRSQGTDGFMPNNGQPLTPSEIKAIADWINAGALNN